VVLSSHSDGINPFISVFDPNAEQIKKPCYCCTVAAEVEVDPQNNTLVKVLSVDVLQK